MTRCPNGSCTNTMGITYSGANGVVNLKEQLTLSLTDYVKMTYLRTLVTGKTIAAITEFACCDAVYKDALRTLERKFGQPQVVVRAHLNKFSNSPQLKMHNSNNIIN